jgi:hypothetical protein
MRIAGCMDATSTYESGRLRTYTYATSAMHTYQHARPNAQTHTRSRLANATTHLRVLAGRPPSRGRAAFRGRSS